MAHPAGALGGNIPHVQGCFHELVIGHAGPVWKVLGSALGRTKSPIEPALGGDHDPLGHVPEHRIGRDPERTPGTRAAGRGGLPPDYLAPEQQTERLEDPDDVSRQAAIGLSAQIGHIDGDAASRLQHPDAFGEDIMEQPEVLTVPIGYLSFKVIRPSRLDHRVLVFLPHEIGGRGNHQSDGAVGEFFHSPGVTQDRTLRFRPRSDLLVRVDNRRTEAGIESRRVVALSASRPKNGGTGRTTRRSGRSILHAIQSYR